MTMPVRCDDPGRTEALVAVLYDELDAAERARVEAHLSGCPVCRAEVNALRELRLELPAWTPPERELGFAIVDRAERAKPVVARGWAMPAWGLAAAAALVLAAAAAVANLDVSYGRDGFRVRTGWSRDASPAAANESRTAQSAARSDAAVWRQELTSLERRLRSEFASPATAGAAVQTAQASADGSPDVLRRVRALIEESEGRQHRELALRFAQLLRDFDRQRQTDLVRIQQGLGQLEGSAAADRELLNYVVRVSQPRQ
jgi:hypothetical protein